MPLRLILEGYYFKFELNKLNCQLKLRMNLRSKNTEKASATAPADQSLLGKRSADALAQDEAQDASENLDKSLQEKVEENKHDKSESLSKDDNF